MRTLTTETPAVKGWVAERILKHLADKPLIPFEIRLPDTDVCRFGNGEPRFAISVRDRQGLSALTRFDELRFSEAYINGSLDIEGNMWDALSCRETLRDIHSFHCFCQRTLPLFTGQVRADTRAIADHYGYANEFFLTFLDPTRCYSQAVFERDDEPLEVAQRRKLDFAVNACALKAGDRVLDVGGGWGAFVEHAGKQGIRVTALTLARPSEHFLRELIQRLQLPCEVQFGDFYRYVSPEPFDAIVILGVMEHLPNYKAVLRQFQRLLKPGGRVYLDASSYRAKYSKPTFISRYVFPGNHRYFCLHDFLSCVARTNLEVQSVYNDYYSYFLTCRAWAKNLESASKDICAQWGDKLYRVFRLYLWGSSYAFYSRSLDAYRVVLKRPGVMC